MNLKILHQDNDLLVVFKPSGLLVHRSELDARARENAMACLRDQLGARVYPVHRLDRAASGALLFALAPEIASRISELFRNRAVEKTYLAWVRGWPGPEGIAEGIIDRELQSRPGGPKLQAVTRYRTLARFELPFASDRHPTSRVALLSLRTDTGRLHQIRKHLHSISHPILGDTVYGHGATNRLLREMIGVNRLMLLGETLSLIHPVNGTRLRVVAPLDSDFEKTREVVEPFRIGEKSGNRDS